MFLRCWNQYILRRFKPVFEAQSCRSFVSTILRPRKVAALSNCSLVDTWELYYQYCWARAWVLCSSGYDWQISRRTVSYTNVLLPLCMWFLKFSPFCTESSYQRFATAAAIRQWECHDTISSINWWVRIVQITLLTVIQVLSCCSPEYYTLASLKGNRNFWRVVWALTHLRWSGIFDNS